MTPDTVIAIGKAAIELTLLILAMLLLPALAVGLLVSMFQAATQINEMTLSFIPKLLVTFAVLIVGGPWILSSLMTYMQRLFEEIPGLVG